MSKGAKYSIRSATPIMVVFMVFGVWFLGVWDDVGGVSGSKL